MTTPMTFATYQTDGLPKPCVHPVVTRRGHVVSGFQMSDHVWHRGLWFTIKFIDGHNFWEENDSDFGVQRGRGPARVEQTGDGATRVTHDLSWTSGTTGEVFTESRELVMRELGDGVRGIDWRAALTATRDLELDRTPFTTWGGYGGLSFRASRELHQAALMTADESSTQSIAGDRAEWVVMSGKMDGGADERVSIGLIDHPSNPRGPMPVYAKTATAGFSFMNAAFLFHEPMRVKAGETLRFRYRVLWRDGVWTADEFAGVAAEFRDAGAEA